MKGGDRISCSKFDQITCCLWHLCLNNVYDPPCEVEYIKCGGVQNTEPLLLCEEN